MLRGRFDLQEVPIFGCVFLLIVWRCCVHHVTRVRAGIVRSEWIRHGAVCVGVQQSMHEQFCQRGLLLLDVDDGGGRVYGRLQRRTDHGTVLWGLDHSGTRVRDTRHHCSNPRYSFVLWDLGDRFFCDMVFVTKSFNQVVCIAEEELRIVHDDIFILDSVFRAHYASVDMCLYYWTSCQCRACNDFSMSCRIRDELFVLNT